MTDINTDIRQTDRREDKQTTYSTSTAILIRQFFPLFSKLGNTSFPQKIRWNVLQWIT